MVNYQFRGQMIKTAIAGKRSSEKLLNLSEEVALFRVIIEEKVNSADSPAGLVTIAPELADLITRVSKLVETADKLEFRRNETLSREALSTFASQISDLAIELIPDPTVMAQFVGGVKKIVANLTNDDDSN
jgi:hypothetical protein